MLYQSNTWFLKTCNYNKVYDKKQYLPSCCLPIWPDSTNLTVFLSSYCSDPCQLYFTIFRLLCSLHFFFLEFITSYFGPIAFVGTRFCCHPQICLPVSCPPHLTCSLISPSWRWNRSAGNFIIKFMKQVFWFHRFLKPPFFCFHTWV